MRLTEPAVAPGRVPPADRYRPERDRPLAPLAPAAYLGVVLALLGAELGGVVWMLGGFLSCFVLAFALNTMAKTRPPATAAIGATVLGGAWIGFGLGHTFDHPPSAGRVDRGR